MHTRVGSAIAIAATLAATGTQAGSAATPKTVICGQIKNGPHATYVQPVNHKKLTGTTWTVFATGAPCAAALKTAPAILKWWATAKIGASNFDQNGFSCNKESDGHGSAGTTGCYYSKGTNNPNIELMMTAAYTIPQLKAMFYIS